MINFNSIKNKVSFLFIFFATLITALVVGAQLFGIPYTEIDGSIEDSRQEDIHQLNQKADNLKYNLSQWIEERHKDIQFIGLSPDFSKRSQALVDITNIKALAAGDYDAAYASKFLKMKHYFDGTFNRLLTAYPEYSDIHLLHPRNGLVLVSSNDKNLGKEILDPASFSFIKNAFSPVSLLTKKSSHTGENNMIFAIPTLQVRDGATAILVFITPISNIQDILIQSQKELGETGEVVFVNNDGIGIRIHGLGIEESIETSRMRAALDAEVEFTRKIIDRKGALSLVSSRLIPVNQDQSITLFLKIDEYALIQKREERLFSGILLAIFAVGLSASLIVVVMHKYLGPLLPLTTAAETIASGGYSTRVETKGANEVGRLENAFNKMAESIQKHVADRKTEENKLVQTLKVTKDTLESMDQGILMVDKNLKVIVYNDRYLEQFSIPQGMFEKGTAFEEVANYIATNFYKDPPRAEAMIKDSRRSDEYSFEIETPDGRDFEVRNRPRTEGGFVRTFTDITKRKKNEAVLQQSGERLDLALKGGDMGFWDVDMRTKKTIVNERYMEMLGYSLEEVEDVDKLWRQSIHHDDRAKVLSTGEDYRSGKQDNYEVEYRAITKSGEERWLVTKGAAVERDSDCEPIRMVGTIRDITERKQAEEAINSQTILLNNIMENVNQGIASFDKNFTLLASNKSYQEFLSLPDELVQPGQDLHGMIVFMAESGFYGPGKPGSLAKQRLQKLQSGKSLSSEVTAQDGKTYLSLVQPIPDGGIVITYTDIAEQKAAEYAISEARDAAEEATKAKATFLATMSHEIRTPMGGVIGMVDILQQTKLTDDQRQMVTTVKESAHSLLTIINDILDFSKIEAGKLDLEEIPISIRDIVEGAGEALAVTARGKNIDLCVYVDPSIPDAVVGDQVRLRQILFNFGTNALKFSEQGIVYIRADKVPSQVKDKITVRFQVIDQGMGIPEEAQKKLFQAFSQVEASTTRRFGGTGLGLTICQRLTELMNGEIGVESVAGEGSSFSVTIPFFIAEKHAFMSDGHDLEGLSVLMALRDPEMRQLVPRYLEHWGGKVTTIAEINEVKSLVLKTAKAGKPFNVVGVGSGWPLEEQIHLVETLAAEEALASTRFLILCLGRTKSERKEIKNTVYVDADPMRRGAFIKSIAVAAGRASPEVEYQENEIIFNAEEAPSVDEAEAMGQLILLAEDNLTNQNVIRRQLNMLGYALEIADDGIAALKMMGTRSYAILLTDCHMPNMDGYTLSQTIRLSENNLDKHFPIIAVTASVMKDEVDHCISAGMDDCLAKPLEMVKLKEMLQKWMPDSKHAATEVAEEPAAVDTANEPEAKDSDYGENSAIDPSALKSVFGDDEETFNEILTEFIDPATENVEEILAGVESHSADIVGAGAHKLKSSSRSVGANELADLCETLETAGKANDWPVIDKAAPLLPNALQSVIKYIENL